jgi:hypothetical protein
MDEKSVQAGQKSKINLDFFVQNLFLIGIFDERSRMKEINHEFERLSGMMRKSLDRQGYFFEFYKNAAKKQHQEQHSPEATGEIDSLYYELEDHELDGAFCIKIDRALYPIAFFKQEETSTSVTNYYVLHSPDLSKIQETLSFYWDREQDQVFVNRQFQQYMEVLENEKSD